MAQLGSLQVHINSMQVQLDYLAAMDKVKDHGGLPSNVEHDEYLLSLDKAGKLDEENQKGYYAAFARELIATPADNKTFVEGLDIVNEVGVYQSKYGHAKMLTLLAKDIPKEAFFQEKVALLIDPESFEVTEEGDKIIIHPKQVTIIKNYLQKSGWGKVDEATRVPTEVTPEELATLSKEQKRFMATSYTGATGQSITPIVRGIQLNLSDGAGTSPGWRAVISYIPLDAPWGVGFVAK